MEASHRYTMLISSLPYHGSLFGEKRAPLSRIRLRQRQHLLDDADRQDLRVVANLLEWARHGMEKSDEAIIAHAKEKLPQLTNAFAHDLIVWRLEVRSVIAGLRRRHRGFPAPSANEAWGYGRWLAHIRRHWNEPQFRLDIVYPWLADAKKMLDEGDALGLERLILSETWEHLDRVSDGHHFDFEAVLIYSMRWDLVARWIMYRQDEAAARFEEMVREGLEDFNPEDLFSQSPAGQ